MNVTLKLNAKSCRRTRNRIREHGPIFRAERSGTHKDHPHNVDKLIGLCWLLRAEDGWLGWLPKDEFRFFTVPGISGPSKCASNVNNFPLDKP